MSNSSAAKTVSSWNGLTSMLPLLLAPLADSYWDRHSTILAFSFIYVLVCHLHFLFFIIHLFVNFTLISIFSFNVFDLVVGGEKLNGTDKYTSCVSNYFYLFIMITQLQQMWICVKIFLDVCTINMICLSHIVFFSCKRISKIVEKYKMTFYLYLIMYFP